MRKLLLFTFLVLCSQILNAHGGKNFEASDIFKSLGENDKIAIVMVHFGTTHADTRKLTIDAINDKVKKTFPGIEVREAYTSRIVVKRLADKGIRKQNPLQVLQQLHKEGYTHILLQSTTIIDGVEMESLSKNAETVDSLFKEIRIGDPLLYAPEDYESVIKILTGSYNNENAYVWVGHGTYDSNTAQYAMLDYMLKSKGHNNCFVGTIEGYPSFDDMLLQLKSSGLKNVVLVPFMFVAGEHAKNDIAEDWKTDLEKEGFFVTIDMTGLGQIAEIQDQYVDHLKFISTHRKIGIMEKKNIYEVTGEKME